MRNTFNILGRTSQVEQLRTCLNLAPVVIVRKSIIQHVLVRRDLTTTIVLYIVTIGRLGYYFQHINQPCKDCWLCVCVCVCVYRQKTLHGFTQLLVLVTRRSGNVAWGILPSYPVEDLTPIYIRSRNQNLTLGLPFCCRSLSNSCPGLQHLRTPL